jgi:DNA end-binding protein Ku
MRQAKVAALARTVLFRRLRAVLIRPHGKGLIGTTLSFDAEVRSAKEAFDDRYDAAVAELVKAKIEGRALPKKKALPPSKQSDLLQALRQSAGMPAPQKSKRAAKAGPKQPKRGASSKRAA